MNPRVRVLRVRGAADKDVPLPARATPGSAGLDVRAALDAPLVLAPGQREAVPTGFALAIPPGYEGQLRPRSGRALETGLTLPNSPGTIDADYRGEVRVILQNGGDQPVTIRRGERIAQLVIAPVAVPELVEVSSPAELGETERGGGGFGHSGR